MTKRKEVIELENEEEQISEELEFDEAEEIHPSDQQIIKKYEEGQARIIIQRNDFLIPNILQMVKDKDVLNLSPNYQRRKRWNEAKRSQLIESLLMNIPIPPIFLYEQKYAKYEVMDGQQRLDAIRGFFQREFALTGLKQWPELNAKNYDELPLTIQRGLQRRGLAAVIILTESGPDKKVALEIRQHVFERLNTGGEKLNAQEVRNCIYASPFNDMLIRIARNPVFTSAWGIPAREAGEPHKVSLELRKNPLYSKMDDCQIVLRYFALSNMEKFAGGMKGTLDDCMIRNLNSSRQECLSMEKQYIRYLRIASKIFGEKLFRLPSNTNELDGRRSVPLADSVLLGIRNVGAGREKLVDHSSYILKRTKNLLSSLDHYETLVGRGNTKLAVQERINLMSNVFTNALKK